MIADLMEEHAALVDQAGHIREALRAGDHEEATSRLNDLVPNLVSHVRREEEGIFSALRSSGEFGDEVDALEGEHRGLESMIAGLDLGSVELEATVTRLLADLDVHIQREELGIFPAAVVTLGAVGWTVVEEAQTRTPSFLLAPAIPGVTDDVRPEHDDGHTSS